MAEVRTISYEDYKMSVAGSDEPFFKKMTRGLKEDKCERIIKAAFVDGEPVAFIATKHFKKYSNLKWIATLPQARGKGAFRALCEDAVKDSWGNRTITMFDEDYHYFRVSINAPALPAYQKVGFKVHGKQRGDCYLSIGRLEGPEVKDIDWSRDVFVWAAINQKPRGGCIETFKKVR